jgi:hypothetical protein
MTSTTTPLPLASSSPMDYLALFTEWQGALHASLQASLPILYDATQQTFMAACQSLASAEGDDAVQQGLDACQALAVQLLDSSSLHAFTTSDYDDTDLVAWTILTQATPHALADWCNSSCPTTTSRSEQVMAFLRNGSMMRQFLEAGGPRNAKYGPALEIYAQLQSETSTTSSTTTHPVLSRLAVAVALELADPHPLFMDQGAVTNALLRYQHYQQAYLDGDLDPAFGQFTVWELRHVVNSDATEDELAWGRASLQAYRPDLALIADNNEQWRFCYLVKSDVTYAKPDWYKSPRSYDQILSGGGKVRTFNVCSDLVCGLVGCALTHTFTRCW